MEAWKKYEMQLFTILVNDVYILGFLYNTKMSPIWLIFSKHLVFYLLFNNSIVLGQKKLKTRAGWLFLLLAALDSEQPAPKTACSKDIQP